jgi:hypothetical protein
MRGPLPQDEDSGLADIFERIIDVVVAMEAKCRSTYVNRKAAEFEKWLPLS